MGIIEALKENAREEGKEEGKEEGEHDKALKIALRMKQSGYSLKEIAQLTALNEEEIQALDSRTNPDYFLSNRIELYQSAPLV